VRIIQVEASAKRSQLINDVNAGRTTTTNQQQTSAGMGGAIVDLSRRRGAAVCLCYAAVSASLG